MVDVVDVRRILAELQQVLDDLVEILRVQDLLASGVFSASFVLSFRRPTRESRTSAG